MGRQYPSCSKEYYFHFDFDFRFDQDKEALLGVFQILNVEC